LQKSSTEVAEADMYRNIDTYEQYICIT